MLIMKNMSKKHIRSFYRIHLYKKTHFLTVAPFDDYLLFIRFLSYSLPFTSFFFNLYSFPLIDFVTLDMFLNSNQ